MDDTLRSRYEAKSAELRADLKTWETEWATSHSGSKPGREDIKNNPDIGTLQSQDLEWKGETALTLYSKKVQRL